MLRKILHHDRSSRQIIRRLSIGLLLVASSLGAPLLAQDFDIGGYLGYYFPQPAGIDDDVAFGSRVIRNFMDRRLAVQGSFTYFKPQDQEYRIYFVEITGSVQFRPDRSLVPHLFVGPGWNDVSTELFEQASPAERGAADDSFTMHFGVGLKSYLTPRRDWYVDMRTTGRWYEARATSTVDREFSIGFGLVFGSGKEAAGSEQ